MCDPLEQFSVVYVYFQIFCSYWYFFSDSILFIAVPVILFLISVIYQINRFTKTTLYNAKIMNSKSELQFKEFILFIFNEFKTTIFGNLILKKQIKTALLFVVWAFLFFSNLFGMIPFSSTITAYFCLTFFLSSVLFTMVTIVGICYNGWDFFKIFLPGGDLPFIIAIFLIWIEFLSFFSRMLSLSIRLFANMVSGHTLLKILIGLVWSLLALGPAYLFIAMPPLLVILVVVFLEFIIAFLQSYIFIILMAIYFNEIANLH